MDDRDARKHGFDDAAELFKLVANADISAPSALAAFEQWKANDGSKEGLVIPTKFLVMYSGGICSWAAAKRIALKHGVGNVYLLFADTIIEDDDLYRFLVESALNVYGFPRLIADSVLSRIAVLTPIEDVSDGALERRKQELAVIRAETMAIIPRLAWIADGRTPWEVFCDERFIGNSKVDPCSKILKRQLMDRWRNENHEPKSTALVFGLDWTERGRITRHRSRVAPWHSIYPLDEQPYLTKEDIRRDLESQGIRQPRLYDLGFPHNNCGGFCVKAGVAQFWHLSRVLPDRYRYHENQETTQWTAK